MTRDFFERQAAILSSAISDFEENRISLGALVHRIEEVTAVVDQQGFREQLIETIIVLEELNAARLAGKALSMRDEEMIRSGVKQVRAAIADLLMASYG